MILDNTEMTVVREALEMQNDMLNDMMFDSLHFNGDEKTFRKDDMADIIKEISENIEALQKTRSALLKVGGRVNALGYSVR